MKNFYCKKCDKKLKKSQVYVNVAISAKLNFNNIVFDIDKYRIDNFYDLGGVKCRNCDSDVCSYDEALEIIQHKDNK